MTTFKTRPTVCPECNRQVAAATTVRYEKRPVEGDISVCAYCQAVLRFDNEGDLRPIGEQTWKALPRAERALINKLRRTLRLYGPG